MEDEQLTLVWHSALPDNNETMCKSAEADKNASEI